MSKDVVRQFSATDANGETYRLEKLIRYSVQARGTKVPEIVGLKAFRTADGKDVTYVSRGRYIIRDKEDILVTSKDPTAP